MILLVVTMASAVKPTDPITFTDGLTIRMNDFDDHPLNNPLYLYGYVYDSSTGVLVNSTCKIDLHYGDTLEEIFEVENVTTNHYTINESYFNKTGYYQSDIYCSTLDGLQGGFNQVGFVVSEETKFGLWKPVEDWTFPVIYLIIAVLIIILALNYDSSILGVLGSVMIIFSYFIIGATSPILFTPLLIVGFLLAFRFATI